jgi:hypothetical protein
MLEDTHTYTNTHAHTKTHKHTKQNARLHTFEFHHHEILASVHVRHSPTPKPFLSSTEIVLFIGESNRPHRHYGLRAEPSL